MNHTNRDLISETIHHTLTMNEIFPLEILPRLYDFYNKKMTLEIHSNKNKFVLNKTPSLAHLNLFYILYEVTPYLY